MSPTDPTVAEPRLKVIAEMLKSGHFVAGPTDRGQIAWFELIEAGRAKAAAIRSLENP